MKSKKIIAVIMAVIMVTAIAIPAVLAIEPAPARMRLTYNQSAKEMTGNNGATVWESKTLPIGNGKLGANVYGEVDDDVMTINEETLWGGGRGTGCPNYDGGNPDRNTARNAYTSISDRLLRGEKLVPADIEALHGDSEYSAGYHDGYLPLGNLRFKGFNHKNGSSNYTRVLDLDNGVSTVSYKNGGVDYTREYFVSKPDNVVVVRFDASKKGVLNFTTSFENRTYYTSKDGKQVLGDVLSSNGSASLSGDNKIGYINYSGEVLNNQLKHNTQVAVVPEGGSLSVVGNEIKVSNANSVTVYLTAATDYANQFKSGNIEYYYRTGETADRLNARVRGVLDSAVTKKYTAVRSAFDADYHKLYDRVRLDLKQAEPNMTTNKLLDAYKGGYANAEAKRYLEVLLFQYGRYLLISGSRENSQIPTTLQGIWNDNGHTDWDSDLHTNINLQMNYWLSNNCNLTECALPLVNYMKKLEEPGHRTAEIYTGAQHGIMAHTQNTPFGYTAPGWNIGTWGWSPAAATWLMQNCYDYFQYSNDKETLRTTIYPMLREQVLMYEELLQDYNGRKVMPIALSPECGPVTPGNTYEQSLIAQLYKDTIEAAEILGKDSNLLDGWRTTMQQLKPIEIGQSGQIKEWYHETTLQNAYNIVETAPHSEHYNEHRHMSNLLGLYPGDIINTPETISAAKISLNYKNFGTPGKTSIPLGGWTYAQMMGAWARVGEAENAYYCINLLLKNRIYPNLWDYHDPNAYQIDANYGYSAGVAEMLLQSNLGYINFLPALTKEWANGSVKGLLAEGNFTVDMEWNNSTLKEAKITAKNAGNCSFKNPFDIVAVVDNTGKIVPVTKDANGICSFYAESGKTYTVKKARKLSLKGSRSADGREITITWDFDPNVKYHIYRTKVN